MIEKLNILYLDFSKIFLFVLHYEWDYFLSFSQRLIVNYLFKNNNFVSVI